MELGKTLRAVAVAPVLAITVLAITVLVAGCSAGSGTAPAPAGRPSSSSRTQAAAVTSVVERWGTFFDDKFTSAGTAARPVAVTLPGIVAEVGSSNSSEYALLTDGSVYAWGLGGDGELGNGQDADSLTTAVRVDFPPGVKIASIPADVMPYDTALAIDTTGHVWGWGDNAIGELCLGNHHAYSKPVELPFSDVSMATGAADHDMYLAAGTLWACGQNVDGDLGDGKHANSDAPVRVAGIDGRDVARLVTSFANSGALLKNGTYYDWGYNGNGQLGDGTVSPGSDVPVRVRVPGRVTQVALGGSVFSNGETLVRLARGAFFSWGDNHGGGLGLGHLGRRDLPSRFLPPKGVSYRQLAASGATGYGIAPDGDVWAWGVSYAGQVGNGSLGVVLRPAMVASGATMISATASNVVIDTPRLRPASAGG